MKTFDHLLSEAGISRSNGYDFYFRNYIYKDIDLDGKKILDIGGGNGIASFHALHSSANSFAWVVDPIAEGSNERMFEEYESMKKYYDSGRVNFHRDYVDTLLEPHTFDIIVMHNTINHIGEDILKDISHNSNAYSEYVRRLKTILDRLSNDGVLIVADCGSKNFFRKMGLKSPFAPSIDWHLHCEPGIWKEMIEEIGFSHIKTQWTARREFGEFGKTFLANRICSYFLNSHFVSFYQKQ
jgi:SAM-dependent methyltransferase